MARKVFVSLGWMKIEWGLFSKTPKNDKKIQKLHEKKLKTKVLELFGSRYAGGGLALMGVGGCFCYQDM